MTKGRSTVIRNRHTDLLTATSNSYRRDPGPGQGQLNVKPTFKLDQQVRIGSSGEPARVIGFDDELGIKVALQFRGRWVHRYVDAHWLRPA